MDAPSSLMVGTRARGESNQRIMQQVHRRQAELLASGDPLLFSPTHSAPLPIGILAQVMDNVITFKPK